MDRDDISIKDKMREKELTEITSVTSIISDVRIKDRLAGKAFSALERRLEPRTKMCHTCKGEGEKSNGDQCGMCQGQGFVIEDADMRAIELVLAPKFPKTNINLNADLDHMSTDELFGAIEKM